MILTFSKTSASSKVSLGFRASLGDGKNRRCRSNRLDHTCSGLNWPGEKREDLAVVTDVLRQE